MKQMESISLLLKNLRQTAPLIHCITNHISINDCANAVLALGARPIMAEHPDEAAEITGHAQALVLNLGNISASRMEAMRALGVRRREIWYPYRARPRRGGVQPIAPGIFCRISGDRPIFHHPGQQFGAPRPMQRRFHHGRRRRCRGRQDHP